MTKANLKPGMLVITADGKARLVMPTKNDGLVLMAEDNRALKLDRMANDLSSGEYRDDKDIVTVYDIMDNVNGHLFDETNRTILFGIEDNNPQPGTMEWNEMEMIDDDDCDCEEECETCNCDLHCVSETPTGFSKSDVTPGMLAVTRDGCNRLAIPTSDMGLVLATEDSKFIRMDKLNDDLTIADYRKEGKNVDKVYGLAAGITTDFYSEDNRPLLFSR